MFGRKKGNRGVGDFDTSDLQDGHKPNSYYHDDKLPQRNGVKVTEKSTRVSRITGSQVETMRADVINGYSVTVNRYNGDSDNLQVFIDNLALDTSIVQTVSLRELDRFIARNTR